MLYGIHVPLQPVKGDRPLGACNECSARDDNGRRQRLDFLQVYLILDEFIMGGEIQETSKKVELGPFVSWLSRACVCPLTARVATVCHIPVCHCMCNMPCSNLKGTAMTVHMCVARLVILSVRQGVLFAMDRLAAPGLVRSRASLCSR